MTTTRSYNGPPGPTGKKPISRPATVASIVRMSDFRHSGLCRKVQAAEKRIRPSSTDGPCGYRWEVITYWVKWPVFSVSTTGRGADTYRVKAAYSSEYVVSGATPGGRVGCLNREYRQRLRALPVVGL